MEENYRTENTYMKKTKYFGEKFMPFFFIYISVGKIAVIQLAYRTVGHMAGCSESKYTSSSHKI